jgi:hypothetical protein
MKCSFSIVAIVVSAIAAAITIANTIYFFRLRRGKTLSSFDLNSMFWVSVILSIGFIAFLGWAVYQAYVGCGVKKVADKHYEYYKQGKTAS